MRHSRRAVLLGLLGLLGAGCLSPTLPLPPPAPPDVQQIGTGEYRLSGVIPFSGTVLVLDQRTELVYGKVVRDVYQLDVAAEVGDEMVIWYQSGDDVSDVTDFTIDEGTPADAGVPPTSDAGVGAADAGTPPPDASDSGHD